jgi:hypothetical protein
MVSVVVALPLRIRYQGEPTVIAPKRVSAALAAEEVVTKAVKPSGTAPGQSSSRTISEAPSAAVRRVSFQTANWGSSFRTSTIEGWHSAICGGRGEAR